LLAATTSSSFAGEKIIASRVWPAQEYTRVTLESAAPASLQHFFVNDPDRSCWTSKAATWATS